MSLLLLLYKSDGTAVIVPVPVCLDVEDEAVYRLWLQNETVTDLELSDRSAYQLMISDEVIPTELNVSDGALYHLDISDENCSEGL